MRSWRGRLTFGNAVRWGFLLVLAGFFGLPMLWLLIAPSKLNSEFVSLSPLAFGRIEGYENAVQNLLSYNNGEVLHWLWNSIVYTTSSLVLALAMAVMAGYALALAQFPGRRLIMWATLIALMVPTSALVLPLFLEMSLVKLVNSPLAVILPAAFFPFGTYLAYVFYATSMPRDLVAAGRVDGCSEWQLFRYICLPLSRTLIGLLAFVSFTTNWNDFLLPFVMLNDDSKFTAPLGLSALASGTPMVVPTIGAGDSLLKRPEGAIFGLLVVIPVAIVFLLAQRYVVRGALTGAIRG